MNDDLQARDRVQVATPEELAAAREARGMSQVDISQRIKLQVKQVKALEQGEWDALPGRSFVRGALRSYGKLIDVDVSPLLESIGGFAEPSQVAGITPLDAPIARSSGLGFNGGGRGSPILWVIAGLIGVVALVLYFGSERDRSGGGSWLRPGTEAPAGSGGTPAPPSAAPTGGSTAPASGSGDTPASGSAAPGGDSSASPTPAGAPSSGIESSSEPLARPPSMEPSPTPAAPPMAVAGGARNWPADPAPLAAAASAPPAAATSPSAVASPSGAMPQLGAAAPTVTPAARTNGSAIGISTGPSTGNSNGPSAGVSPTPSTGAANGPSIVRTDTAGPGAASATDNGTGTPRASSNGTAAAASRPDGAVATPELAPLASARTNPTEPASPGSAAEAPAGIDTKGLIRLQAGSQDSWIEVRQADGTALHNGLVKAGESVDLKGTPPYRLILGNASHVTLTYEGKPRELGPHMRANNIARLQLR